MGRTVQYLVVIYALEQAEGTPVPTGRIAGTLDRSPSATTEMMQRLAADNLVEYERYSGVQLTAEGQIRATELYETHETLCRFFRDILTIDDYAREALLLAGTVSPKIAHRLETTVLPQTSLSKEITPLPLETDHSMNSADDPPYNY